MPFGLNVAPRLFTWIMKDVISQLHSLDIQVVIYLDDFLVIIPSYELGLKWTNTVVCFLLQRGWLVNLAKSHLVPQQRVKFLGVLRGSVSMSVRLSPQNAHSFSERFRSFRSSFTARLRDWQSLVSAVNFTLYTMLRIRLLVCRLTRLHAQNRQSPLVPLQIPAYFWALTEGLSSPFVWEEGRPLSIPSNHVSVLVDASLDWRGVVRGELDAVGRWSEEEGLLHINILELKACIKALLSWSWDENSLVQFSSDNKVAVAAICKFGSTTSAEVQGTVDLLMQASAARNIQVTAKYIPGPRNVLTGQLSQSGPVQGEWALSREAFQLMLSKGFQPQVDMFSTDWNHQLPTYCTPYKSLITPETDAFSLNWDRWSQIYLFPPTAMLL